MGHQRLILLSGCALLLTGSVAPGQQSPEQLLQTHLLAHCGQCHTGPQRVVKRFDMSQVDSLKQNKLLDVAAPLESPIWKRVDAGKMPPATAKPLPQAAKTKLARLLGDLIPTIQQYVDQDGDVSTFVSWAKKSGLWQELPTIGSYTFFVPSNQAVADLGEANQKFLLDPPPETKYPLQNLRSVILNHGVVLARLNAAELKKRGKVMTLRTELTIREGREGALWISDAKIIRPDIACRNGIVHVIDKVLVPASIILPGSNIGYYWPDVAMMSIPGGQFQMGAPANEAERYPSDGPPHPVTLRPFQIGVYEIMHRQFKKVMEDPSGLMDLRGRPDDGPVQNLSWYEAVQFCNAMSKQAGLPEYYQLNNPRQEGDNEVYDVVIPNPASYSFRLPTEAEWEYACRAKSVTAFCCGDDPQQLDEYAWHAGNVGSYRVSPVGMKKPNAFGLYDMHGNVSEWCHDWYEPNYSTTTLVADPLGPAGGDSRVIRGGSYMWFPEDCRSAARWPARSHAALVSIPGDWFSRGEVSATGRKRRTRFRGRQALGVIRAEGDGMAKAKKAKAVARSIGALDRRQLAAIDAAALEFEQAWKAGQSPQIESFLQRPVVEIPLHGVLFEELLTLEMEYRLRRGESPDMAAYVARFPHLEEQVESVFDRVCPSIFGYASHQAADTSHSGTVLTGAQHDAAQPNIPAVQLPPDDRPLPKRIGRYTILRRIAEGGFGRVLLAKDTDLNRLVAIKVSRKGLFSGEDEVSRFLEEVRMAAQLKHPNIVSIHDVGRDGELGCFIVMDFIDGGPLDVADAAAHLSYNQVASLIAHVAAAVHYAHTKGIVHRDLKPGNILLDSRHTPYVADFGLAVHESVQQDHEGEVSGTPPYMSPEQVRGLTHHMDGRTDIWTLGVLLYELLTGRRPFVGRTRAKVFDEILNRDPKPPRQVNDAIPVELECICLKSLHKQPADRYSTALDLAESLRHAIAKSPDGLHAIPPVPPPLPTVTVVPRRSGKLLGASVAVAGIVLLAAVAYLLQRPPPPAPQLAPQLAVHDAAGLANALPVGCSLLAISPGAEVVAAVERSGSVRLFTTAPPRLVHTFPHGQPVTDLSLSRDGDLLAVLCLDDPRVYLYETRAPYRSVTTTLTSNPSSRLVPAPHNDHDIGLAQFNNDGLQLQDVMTGKITRRFSIGLREAAQLAISNGQLIVGGYDARRGCWLISRAGSTESESHLAEVGPIGGVAASRDGTYLACCGLGDDGGILLAAGGKTTSITLPAGTPLEYRQAAFAADGRLVTVCWRTAENPKARDETPFGHLCVWDVADPARPLLQRDFDRPVDAAAIALPFVCLATGDAWELLEIGGLSADLHALHSAPVD